MTITGLSRELATFRIHWPTLAWQASAGFLFCYVVLHPVSMVIFQCLDPRIAATMPPGMHEGFLGPIAHSFSLQHLPMGLVFGLVTALIATGYGYHCLALAFQRDCLAWELRCNEEFRAQLAGQADQLKQQNEELARLELTDRKSVV